MSYKHVDLHVQRDFTWNMYNVKHVGLQHYKKIIEDK